MSPAMDNELEAEMEASSYAMKLTSYSVLPMCLSIGIELGLFEIFVNAGNGVLLTADELVARLSASNPRAASMIDSILRLLASHQVLTCSITTAEDGRSVRRYGAAPPCKYMTRNEHGVSVSDLAMWCNNKTNLERWYYVKDAVLHGGVPFNLAHHGKSELELHHIYSQNIKGFGEAMASHTLMVMKNILDQYHGFNDVNNLVDVGGGVGGILAIILARHPHLKGINFDLPHVIAKANAVPGVEFVGGDMFTSVPSGDAIFMMWVLHEWSDDDCVRVLENCRRVLPAGKGKVIVVECFLPETPEGTDAEQAVFHLDMIMLTQCPQGRERTETEFRTLAKRAGFSEFRAVCCVSSFVWVMEFKK